MHSTELIERVYDAGYAAKQNGRDYDPQASESVGTAIEAHDGLLGMLTAFRHAANGIGVEAGVIGARVSHVVAQTSVCRDAYFLELIAEAELRFKRLSIRYEKLRAAAIPVVDEYDENLDNLGDLRLYKTLREVLKNDL